MSTSGVSTAARWLMALIATTIVVVGAGVALVFTFDGDPTEMLESWPRWVVLGLAIVQLAVGGFAMVRLRLADPGALRLIAFWLAFLLVIGGIDGVIGALTGSSISTSSYGPAFGWAIVFAIATVALFALLRFVLSFGTGVMGVARTVVDEAMRLKIALVFIVLLLVLLPLLPFTSGDDEQVRYRVQQFLSYGQTLTAVLLSLMTIFLACWTLTSEVADKQIFTIATKPIGRGSYLLGKWLGIVLLNGVLVAVASLAIYGFTVGYLAQLPPKNPIDALELRERVLVSRVSQAPMPAEPFEERVSKRLETMLREEPGTIMELGKAYATELGMNSVAMSDDELMRLGASRAIDQLTISAESDWMSLQPMRTQRYVFTGLQNASKYGQAVQWRYKMSSSKGVQDDQLKFMIRVNETTPVVVTPVVGQVQEFAIPAALIGDDGVLNLDVRHFDPTYANNRGGFLDTVLTFRAKEMRILFQVDSFGPNFARAMLVLWLKLGFLAMLGLLCATFLSFPVAAVLALMVYGGAVLSPFVLESLGGFTSKAQGVEAVVKGFLAIIAAVVAQALAAWGEYSPAPMVVDGLHFGWGRVLECVFWIGFVWTGLAGLLAWLCFRKRELAKVQV